MTACRWFSLGFAIALSLTAGRGLADAPQGATAGLSGSAQSAVGQANRGTSSREDLARQVDELSKQGAPAVVQWRRDLHAHPELGNCEQRTAGVVAEQLRAMGIENIKTGVAKHGVVAVIVGGKPGPTVALRADMDALPIEEHTGLPFASQNRGVMHACGHDAHTAILLGTAQVLVKLRAGIPGTVKLIFQPAEEGAPAGEEGGAARMIKEGVLQDPAVKAIFALHVKPELETGKLSYRPGVTMASVDRFRITVVGKQSHAALPWQGVDPIVAAAHVITAVQTIVSRHVDARQPVVVSIGIVRAGTAWNIIPGQVMLEGTIRTHDEEVRRGVAATFRRLVQFTAQAHGCTAEIVCDNYAPAVWNDPALAESMKTTLARVVGESNLVDVKPSMGGEDFAHYARKVPGLFVFLGVRNESIGAVHAIHTPEFQPDEASLPVGVRTLSLLAIDYLQMQSTKSGK